MTELWMQEASEIADDVRRGQISAQDVVDVFLRRIELHDPTINAFCHLDPERALTQAQAVDDKIHAGEDPGLLAGVPIAVKEDEQAAGMPMRLGTVMLADQIAQRDSTTVQRLREQGAVVVGTTTMPECGTGIPNAKIYGTTRNPWNPSRTTEGSSSGSAAAVAAGLVPIATGGDGGGSVRKPAALCGLFGVKGTYGRIPLDAPGTLHTVVRGPLARSVRDAARYYDCVIGPTEGDPFSLPHPGFRFEEIIREHPTGLRAAWSTDLGYAMCSREIETICRNGTNRLAAAAGIQWSEPHVELVDMAEPWRLLAFGGLAKAFGWERIERHRTHIAPFILEGLDWARRRLDEDPDAVHKVQSLRDENNKRLAELFSKVDILITPVIGTHAYPANGPLPDEIDGEPVPVMRWFMTYPFNFSGHPAVSIPCGMDHHGVPVGLQLVGRRHADHTLFALAAAFEEAYPWPKQPPGFE